MEARNSGAESQTSDQFQPIQEIDGGGGLTTVVAPADAVNAADGGEGVDIVKKKRGRPPRVQAKSPPAKINKEEDEDVCFICFDGGSLVLCDRRGCPKAYHPACVKRDEAFFQSKAKWNCGWHICSICQKAAHHMCYSCAYSLCKGCIKKADYVCVRGDKGFCAACMRTIMLIENSGHEKDEKGQVDFDDKASWEYLFKVYWIYLKGKLLLTLDELTQAKNPWKEASTNVSVIQPRRVHNGVDDRKNMSSDMSPQNVEASESKRRKTDEEISITPKETVITKKPGTDEKWATKELLDFVSHMKSGDTSLLSQFDVQELMLEYIKRNNLRDPRKKSQIICDSRLKILFGKPRVGHFEMLKLLEFHFFINEDLSKKSIKSIARQVDPDWNIDHMVTVGKDKKRKNHKKVEEHVPQNKLDEYAAIDEHNMNLIYLRRKLMENLIRNSNEFYKKVVGSIVRIRISGSDQKHDMYRLVQVVGTRKADAPYKIGNKSADVVLEVLNLDKKETVSIDTISNQDLSEDECRRLRQSIRCGLVKRFTVGEIQDKVVSLQSVRLNDLMEAETLRLNNLRDRASEKGHKKSLREYVEKLQLLKTPEERERRLREIPEVRSDPKMNPDYETDDTEEYFNKEQGEQTKLKYSVISRKSSSFLKKGKVFSNNVGTKAIGRINMKKDGQQSMSSGQPQSQVDYNSSTITNQNNNSASETSTSSYSMKNTSVSNDSELDKIWHYRDPSGKIQGPFCMVQLQKWSTTGYFPHDMRIWKTQEDESLLLNDVLNQQLHNKTTTEKAIRIEGLTARTTNLSFTKNSVNQEKSSGESNESNMTDLASPILAIKGADIKNVSVFDIANADLVDLPSPTPKEAVTREDEKVQNVVDKEAGTGGARLPETTEDDHVVIPSSSLQPGYDSVAPLHGVRETIEFSVLAEESVSDLWAEVDAMESQNGLPSPTTRRNSFVEDLFDESFEEFSPTPNIQPTTTTVGSSQDSSDLQFKWPEIPQETINKDEIDVNNSIKVDRVRETNAGGSNEHNKGERTEPTTTKSKDPPSPPQSLQPTPPSVSLTTGLDKVYPQGNMNNIGRAAQEAKARVVPHLNTSRGVMIGWDMHQRTYGGDRFNHHSPRERSYRVEDSGYSRIGKPWVRQSSFGNGGGYSPKGQRVCKFYESGRCKKGASCNYWHP